MTFLEGLLWLAGDLLTFYVPVFYTVKSIMSVKDDQIRTSLKFWAILSLYYLFRSGSRKIIAEQIFPYLDLMAIGLLNFRQFTFSEKIYDTLLAPLYRQNKQSLEALSNKIEALFNQNSALLKKKAANSAVDKLKGFMGEVLVGTLRPVSSQRREEEEEDQRDDKED